MLQKYIRKALTHLQNFLYVDSEHLKLLKYSIPYTLALRIKQTCTTLNDFNQCCEDLKHKFVNQGYKSNLINVHLKAAEKVNRKELLNERDNTTSKETKIPLVLTYNWSLQNTAKVVCNHWNILSINKSFNKIFQNETVTAFKHNENLRQVIGSTKIEYNKVKKHTRIMKKGKCSWCSVNNRPLCCKQVISLSTFKRPAEQ